MIFRHSISFLCIATSLLSTTASKLSGENDAAATPVEITNTGDIWIDQDGESVIIEKDVEVYQSPFTLTADLIRWNQYSNDLLATGKVRLLVDPTESNTDETNSFLVDTLNPEGSEQIEVLKTEQLSFDPDQQTIQPTGIATIQFGFARIIGEDFHLNLQNDTMRSGPYRVGFSNLFLEGDSLHAEESVLTAENAHFFIGEPEKLSIQGHAKKVEKQGDESVILKGVRLQLGPLPIFYWPYYRHDLKRQVFSISGGAGYSGDIGAYTELRPTYQPKKNLKFFQDFNFYSERGILTGPGWNLALDLKSGHHIQTKLESGYIHDNGSLGFDILDQPIQSERHYIDFEYLHSYKETTQILSRIERWSDSEILRDFETGKFRSIQQPQTFIEMDHQRGAWALSLSAHVRHEAFEYATERTPELTLSLLPTPIAKTDLYHSAMITGAKMRNSDPDQLIDQEQNRFRAYYQLLYPISLTKWLDLTPQATIQHLYYRDTDLPSMNFGMTHTELGFDLTAHAFGEWQVKNRVWNVNGLRHILNPTLQFRKIEKVNAEQDSPLPIEAKIFRTGVDDLDLTANTYLDDLDSYSILRLGLLNSVFAKTTNSNVKELLDFDLYYDTYFPEDDRLDNTSVIAANLSLKPAYWLKLSLQSRYNTDPLELSDLFARLQLIDGDIWDLDIATQFIRNDLQQYVADFRYKVFENMRFVSSVGFDVRKSRFFEQTYGFQFGIANYWDLYLSVNFRDGSKRNNETRFELKIKTARF